MSQSGKKSRIRLGLFTTSFLLGSIFAVGFSLWYFPQDYLGFPPCADFSKVYHFKFKPNCAGEMITPRGMISLFTNEDGLREAAREEILKFPERILVLGGAMVEGIWLKQEELLSQILQQKNPDKYFVNAGIREQGPIWQVNFLKWLIPIYKPQAVLWIVDEKSQSDDNITCQVQGDFSAAEKRFKNDMSASSWLWGFNAEKIQAKSYFKSRQALSEAEKGSPSCHCAGIRLMLDFSKKYQVVMLPVFISTEKSALPDCFEEWAQNGRPFLQIDLAGLSGLYFSGSKNLNPSGVENVAAQIARWPLFEGLSAQ